MPKLLVAQHVGRARISFDHIKPEFIGKPILLKDIERIAQGKAQFNDSDIGFESSTVFGANFKVLKRITGMRLLIVDDNDINLEVAKGILEHLPIEIDTASNGEQVLNKLQAAEAARRYFNLILMDCQMPIMNGYTCAEKIRAGYVNEPQQSLAIIAMTANAMLGEKEKCLAAGMNDYVTKPIVAQEIEAKVIEWLAASKSSNEQAQSGNSKDKDVHVDVIEHWNHNEALGRLMNNEELLNRICTMFVTGAPKKFALLQQAVTENDTTNAKLYAHAMKGLAGEVCAKTLHGQFSEIEIMYIDNQLNYVEERLREAEAELTVVLNLINAFNAQLAS